MLQLFSINVYALLDLDATLSFVTPLVAIKFDMLLSVLDEPFPVSNHVGDSVVPRRVYRGCPISFPNTVTFVDLIELDTWTLMSFLGWNSYMLILLQLNC